MKEIPHGTASGYNYHRCRCEQCRSAWNAYARERRRGVCATCGGPVGNKYVSRECHSCRDAGRAAKHGTESKYTGGCRCDTCRAAHAVGRLQRRHANLEAARKYGREYMARRRAEKRREAP